MPIRINLLAEVKAVEELRRPNTRQARDLLWRVFGRVDAGLERCAPSSK